jgi:hypothetical protein
MVFFLSDFLAFHLLSFGASETFFWGFGLSGTGLGGGFSITGATDFFVVCGLGMTTVLAADLGAGAGAAAGGPGNDTKLTLIDPGDNRRLGADSGKMIMYPINPK